jgi:hypothetical protein
MGDTGHQVPRLGLSLAAICRWFMRDVLDPYRPELHYMRGPGPKWRAKHGIAGRPAPAVVGRPVPACG